MHQSQLQPESVPEVQRPAQSFECKGDAPAAWARLSTIEGVREEIERRTREREEREQQTSSLRAQVASLEANACLHHHDAHQQTKRLHEMEDRMAAMRRKADVETAEGARTMADGVTTHLTIETPAAGGSSARMHDTAQEEQDEAAARTDMNGTAATRSRGAGSEVTRVLQETLRELNALKLKAEQEQSRRHALSNECELLKHHNTLLHAQVLGLKSELDQVKEARGEADRYVVVLEGERQQGGSTISVLESQCKDAHMQLSAAAHAHEEVQRQLAHQMHQQQQLAARCQTLQRELELARAAVHMPYTVSTEDEHLAVKVSNFTFMHIHICIYIYIYTYMCECVYARDRTSPCGCAYAACCTI